MYSIVTIVYGVPLTEKISNHIDGIEDDAEYLGWKTLYHGGSPHTIGYCGVVLDEFTECQSFIDPSKLRTLPTVDEINSAKKLISKLDKTHQKILSEENIQMQVYYIFSTS